MHFDEIYVTWKVIQLWTTWGLMVAKIKVCRKPTIYIAAAAFLLLFPSSISSVLILQDPWFLNVVLLKRRIFSEFIEIWLITCFGLIFGLALTCFRSIYLWIIRNLVCLQINVQFHKTGASRYIIGKVADQSYDPPHLQPSKAQVNSTHT